MLVSMVLDRNGLEILTRAECVELLHTKRIGRVALSMRALPVVLPVSYALLGSDIVVRTGPGSKLEAALTGAVVGFEVDDIDEATGTGWSVLVQGAASVLDDPAAIKAASQLQLRPWSRRATDRFVRITTVEVTGRRLTESS
jgi:uncharacterized protein